MGGEHAEVPDGMPLGRRDEGGKTSDERKGLKLDGGRAIGPRALEVQPHRTVGQEAQAVVNMETQRGFPNLPAMVRGRQSRPAPHAMASGGRSR